MALSTPELPKDRRFQLRANAHEESLIKVAAERQGINVTDFILGAAREKAEAALADQAHFAVDDAKWRQFLAALDRPAKDKPRLRKLFRERHIAQPRS